jgi:hypothetical protein
MDRGLGWIDLADSAKTLTLRSPWSHGQAELTPAIYFDQSKAHVPDPHWGRPHPMVGAPVSPQMGKELERPEWAEAGMLNCLARSTFPHFGQRAVSLVLRIRVSKMWSQGWQ